MEQFDVVVVGSLNLDLVIRTLRLPAPGETVSGDDYAEFAGGKGLNQAVAAARAGARVAMIGAVGDDRAGAFLRGVVLDEGIDDRRLVTDRGAPTGRALITVDHRGENSIVIVAGANGSLTVDDLPSAAVVLAQLETNGSAVRRAFEIAHDRGATTVLNPAPAEQMNDALLDLVDVVVPNEHEVALLGGELALAERVEHVVVTRGGAGADHVVSGTVAHVSAFPVEPVDTTGAGDAFCGSLASRLAVGDDISDALRFAAAAGALATTRHGAVPSLPTIDEVMRLLADTTA